MKSFSTNIKTLKDLFLFFENQEIDPSVFYRFFGKRKSLKVSVLDPVTLLAGLRKNIRFLQGALLRFRSVPLIIFFDFENKFLRRQLYFLSLKSSRIVLIDIREVGIHSIYSKVIRPFCAVSLFLNPEQEYQLTVQSQKNLVPTVFFKSPSSNELRGDGTVVSSFDSCPSQMLIVHFLCLVLTQVLKLNVKINEKKF